MVLDGKNNNNQKPGGTMGAVPRDIYGRIVDDTLRLLAPILDNPHDPADPPLGGFVDLEIAA